MEPVKQEVNFHQILSHLRQRRCLIAIMVGFQAVLVGFQLGMCYHYGQSDITDFLMDLLAIILVGWALWQGVELLKYMNLRIVETKILIEMENSSIEQHIKIIEQLKREMEKTYNSKQGEP